MSSSRHRRDDDGRRDSYDEYERRDSYRSNSGGRNGYEDGYGGGYDRDGYRTRDYDDDKSRSRERRHRSPDDRALRRSSRHDNRHSSNGRDSKDETPLQKVKHSFGASEESYVATGVGAVAGAFLGSEATKGKKNGPMATILGAVLGGLSANAIDKQYEMRREKRKEERRGSRDDDRRR